MTALMDMPFELRSLYTPQPPLNGDARMQVDWLRERIRSTAEIEAMLAAHHEALTPPYSEVMQLACAMSQRLQWPVDIANAALKAEWAAAREKAGKTTEAVEKAVRRLAYERAPGDRILTAARTIIDAAGLWLPDHALLALARRIAHATLPRRRVAAR